MYKKIKRLFAHIYGRIKNGYSGQDTWSFDLYLARVIKGGSKCLCARMLSHPDNLTESEWTKILNQISEGFDAYLELHNYGNSLAEYKVWLSGDAKKLDKKYKTGMNLFVKYFEFLWD